jgi:hypothetical protein
VRWGHIPTVMAGRRHTVMGLRRGAGYPPCRRLPPGRRPAGGGLAPERYGTGKLPAPAQVRQGRAKDVPQSAVLWIERTPDGLTAALQDMGIDHGSAHIFMPQEFLHGADVIAIFQQMRRETMA